MAILLNPINVNVNVKFYADDDLMRISDDATELREAVADEIRYVVSAFSDSQMEALLTGDLVAAHERITALTHSKETPMSICSSCNVERSTEPDYSPIQAITGQPFGWYSGDDGEMCPVCFTDIFDTANRTRHPKETTNE